MAQQRQKYMERMQEIALKNSGPVAIGSPTQEAAVRALRDRGPLTQREINEFMDVKFKNARSLDLALCQMEKRGVVPRAPPCGPGRMACNRGSAQIPALEAQ
jgi:hypothetical protein